MERLFEDVTVEEEQSLQRDILGGSRHLSLHRQMGQKGGFLGFPCSQDGAYGGRE